MDKKTELGILVGIDINQYYVQISCLDVSMEQPQTLTTQMGTEQYEIPLCLFRQEEEVWYYGEKARKHMYSEHGVYVENLWEGMLAGRELYLEEESFSYEKLMGIFMKKVLKLVYQCGFSKPVEAVAFTVRELDDKKLVKLHRMVQGWNVPKDRLFFLDYQESFAAYVTNGPKEIWNHEVFLFYYYGRMLRAYQLRVNQKTLPFTMKVEEVDYGELEYDGEELADSAQACEEMDARFLATVQQLFDRRVVSGVYLIGDGFKPGWMKNSLRVLCRGRRVFQGNNLFTKGACFAAAWYLGWSRPAGQYLSLQMIEYDVRIPMGINGKEYLYLAKRGDVWYHAGADVECLLNGVGSIQIEVIEYGGQPRQLEEIELLEYPKRPKRADRVQIHVEFSSSKKGTICVKDLGMGEFYPSSGLTWQKEFLLSGEEELA